MKNEKKKCGFCKGIGCIACGDRGFYTIYNTCWHGLQFENCDVCSAAVNIFG